MASTLCDDPVVYIDDRWLYGIEQDYVPLAELDLATVGPRVVREGRDLTLVGASHSVQLALDAAHALAAEGVSAEVVDLRSLRPLDRATIVESVRKTGCAVVAEDDWLTYGIGAEIAATIQEGAFDWLDAPVRRVAMAEVPLPYAKSLESAALPSAESLLTAVRDTLRATGRPVLEPTS